MCLGPMVDCQPTSSLRTMLGRNMSQKLSGLLIILGLAWGLMLLRYTVQQPRHKSSGELRQQILELSRRYVKVLNEENQNTLGGPQGPSMAGYADLKRTIAVLLDDILTRLVKLEGKMELVANTSATNSSHPAAGSLASAPVALHKQDTPGNHRLETPRLPPQTPNRPRPGV
uniref:Transformer 2 alpha homolog n=3 Tax=Oncorhynchus TaxID=8016 RepID=A0A8C7N4Y7_ONCKI